MSTPIFLTPEQRLQAAAEKLHDINRVLPKGMPPMQLPPWSDLAATIDALARVLIEKGLVSEEEFLAAKTVRLAEIVEEFLAVAEQAKRQASGLIIAQPGQQPV